MLTATVRLAGLKPLLVIAIVLAADGLVLIALAGVPGRVLSEFDAGWFVPGLPLLLAGAWPWAESAAGLRLLLPGVGLAAPVRLLLACELSGEAASPPDRASVMAAIIMASSRAVAATSNQRFAHGRLVLVRALAAAFALASAEVVGALSIRP